MWSPPAPVGRLMVHSAGIDWQAQLEGARRLDWIVVGLVDSSQYVEGSAAHDAMAVGGSSGPGRQGVFFRKHASPLGIHSCTNASTL